MPRTATIPSGETLRAAARPLTGSAGDYDPLLELIGDARIVLLGEASHGTHEFYRERARITQRLIEELLPLRLHRGGHPVPGRGGPRGRPAGPLPLQLLRPLRGGLPGLRLCGRGGHVAHPLEALLAHFDRKGGRTRAGVWEHNSHIGDARATSMGREGELNVGQLTRERHGSGAVLVGLSTYTGTVTAASDWGAPAERKRVRPALAGSFEALFHPKPSGSATTSRRGSRSSSTR